MNTIFLIAKDELRYWQRSKTAWIVLLLLLMASISAAVVSSVEDTARAKVRQQQQEESDAIFQAQPDRHPHRMVHYGHYVYRTDSPLAVIDSGIDSMVGTSIFLEGHRQNTATFTAARETGLLARFGNFSPGFTLQTLVPLLLIICGFATITREKENKTLFQLIGQGVSSNKIVLGKSLALWLVALVALIPLLVLGISASAGNSFGFRQSLNIMTLGYLAYLCIWVFMIVSISAFMRTSSQSLSLLLGLWIVAVVLIPRLAGAYANTAIPSPSQIETNLRIAEAMRQQGDSHNFEDDAFIDLRTVTLAEYGVEIIEELPFNYRGLVAVRGEEADTEVLRKFSEERMAREVGQKNASDSFSWLSPTMGMRAFSMALAGTALQDHHHFLRAAEDYRFNMVQTFNRLQMTELTLEADLARNESALSNQRTRLDSSNWSEMPVFELHPLNHDQRWLAASQAGLSLGIWLFFAFLVLLLAARRLRP